MRPYFTLILSFLLFNAFAQKGDIEIRSSPYDFGKVYNWDNPPAVFEIINKSDETLKFLPTFPTQNFQIKLPQHGIAPGKSARVEVFYYTKELGSFSEKVNIYTSNSSKAIELKIKGEIISMSPSAFTACPTINKDKATVQEFYQEVLVVDGKTRKPLENAEIKWFYNNRTKYKNTTDKNGKVVEEIVMGNYSLLAVKDGYEPNTANGLISRNTGLIIIPLNPVIPNNYGKYEVNNKAKAKKDPAEGGIYYPITKKETPAAKNEKSNGSESSFTIKESTDNSDEEKEAVANKYDQYNDRNRNHEIDNSKHSIDVPNVTLKDKESMNTTADFSDVRVSNVELNFESEERDNENDSEAAQNYRDRINAIKERERQEQETSAWKSPFDSDDSESETTEEAQKTESITESELAENPEKAKSPELEFYNRESKPEKAESMENAAYLAYLEEIRQLEEKLNAEYEKPNFYSEEEEMESDYETASSNTGKNASEPIESNVKSDLPTEQKTKVMDPALYGTNNVLFLLDISTSMRGKDKMDLLKLAMSNLIEVLRDFDYLPIMTYSSETNVVQDRIQVKDKAELKNVINSLTPVGWTYGLKGLGNAFDIVNSNYISEGNNQIIISTDGEFNNPTFTERDLYSLVREKGGDTKLSVIGFGNDKDALSRMKKLARVGNGNFIQISNESQAGDALIEEIKAQSLLD